MDTVTPVIPLDTVVSTAKSFFAFFGLGSALSLVDLYRKRARVRIRIIDEDFGSDRSPRITFEAENVGMTATSMKPVVHLCGLSPWDRAGHGFKMTPRTLRLTIEQPQRSLVPQTPVVLNASDDSFSATRDAAALPYLHLLTYTFCFTRGLRRRVRVRILFPVSKVPPEYRRQLSIFCYLMELMRLAILVK